MATDTIISFIFGITALICIVIAFIIGIATKGHAGRNTGVLLLASLVMAITGFIFGLFGLKQVEGGTSSKRVAILLSVIAMVILLLLVVL